jgi:hypothetical protein
MNAARDSFGNFAKFVPPLVASGRVYVATWSNQVAVYGLPPIVGTVAPNRGSTSGGTPVTITGSNFVSGATVTVGGTAATSVVVVNQSTITAKTPPRRRQGGVTVVVADPSGQSGTLNSAFTYVRR